MTCKKPNCTNKTKSMGRNKTGEQKFRRLCELHRRAVSRGGIKGTPPLNIKTRSAGRLTEFYIEAGSIEDSLVMLRLARMASEQKVIMREEEQKKFGSWTRRYREAEIVYNYLMSMAGEIEGTAK